MKKIFYILLSIYCLQASAQSAPPVVQSKEKSFLKVSIGPFVCPGYYMQNKTYAWQQLPNGTNTITNTSNYVLAESGYTPFPAGLCAMVNYARGIDGNGGNKNWDVGISAGLGLTLETPGRLVYLLGPSIFLGKNHHTFINVGVSGMSVNKLNNNLEIIANQQINYTNPPSIDYYKQFKYGCFFAFSFNPFS